MIKYEISRNELYRPWIEWRFQYDYNGAQAYHTVTDIIKLNNYDFDETWFFEVINSLVSENRLTITNKL